MKKLRIFLDSDEVLMNFIDPLLEKYNAFYCESYKREDILTWELSDSLKEGTDVYQFMDMPGFFKELSPFEGAALVVQKLIEDGHDIVISTAGRKHYIMDKYDSFEKHFPFLKFENILMIKRKDVLVGDIMLDDGLHNLTTSSCKYPIAMNRKWNEEWDGLRVSNLEEFYELVCELAKEDTPSIV